MTNLANTCAFLGDVGHAEELRDQLLPYAGRNVVIVEGWACLGSADRPLGRSAARDNDGRWDDAERARDLLQNAVGTARNLG